MSSRPSERPSLHPPVVAAAADSLTTTNSSDSTCRSHNLDRYADPFVNSPTAASATDALHAFKLRNSRSALANSTVDPPRFSTSTSSDDSATASSQFVSPSPARYTSSLTNGLSSFTPTVNLPSTDSTPQRTDSGFEDHNFSHKQSSIDSNSSRYTNIDHFWNSAANLSPIVGSPQAISNIEGYLDARPAPYPLSRKTSAPNLKPTVSRTPSLKSSAAFALGFGSAASSRVPSPIITAMGDVTPLPSPLLSGDSPGPWKRLHGRPPSREAPQILPTIMSESALVTSNGESIASALANQSKRKSLASQNKPSGQDSGGQSEKEGNKTKIHTRNRSISEYHPDPLNVPKRMVTVSGSRVNNTGNAPMRREPHLSEVRGLTPIEKPPSPPPSESSVTGNDTIITKPELSPNYEYFDARGRKDGKLRRWRAVKSLGQGTFSRVVLATSHVSAIEDGAEANNSHFDSGLLTPEPIASLDRKSLVAVKICEHGPKGGASEDRVEMSLKRELEIMQSIHHPCLVDLKAWNIEPTRAILVLSYCPGGDLFDVATAHKDLLVPSLVRRIFTELVGAVRYLHERHIVHRDIKLENVLVNLPPQELSDRSVDWQAYPYSVITLTDLGLSRRVADDEKLTTRCGSEDYAAPEVIMGLEYDGRATDSWSLGVLLYALLESRLPFDPPPGASDAHRMRSRTSHRIARVEWQWYKYTGDDGDHEGNEEQFKAAGLLGAMEITENLLKRSRSRWPLEKVAETEWVQGGVTVGGGIKFREEDDGEEVL